MAILNISPDQVIGSKGIEKKIDKGAEKMVFNILQATMYSFPVESTVRELTSNAVDAVKEKIIAINILTGKNKPEDYFIVREGDEYKDSKWKPDYYNLKDLDNSNLVKLDYYQKEGLGFCDRFEVTDPGVGLSIDRFMGVIGIGYSTKRNTTSMLGAFGAGAKSALSTGCDYYIVESVYDHKKLIANCYKYKTDFIIGKFNMTTKEENKFYLVDNSEGGKDKIYYEDSTSLNYTKIIVPSKKINRDKFKDAVKKQLCYFDKILFSIHYENGHTEIVDFKASVLYNSDNIIISDSNYYSRPHIVITKSLNKNEDTGVTYGTINFKELEIEELYGSIGVKCPVRSTYMNEDGEEVLLTEGVELVPSRESVVWSEHTRDFIKKQFGKVVAEASELVQEQLKEEDFIIWLQRCYQVLNNTDNYSVLGRMSKVIDRSQLSPAYPKNKSIRFSSNPETVFKGLKVRNIAKTRDYANAGKEKIERSDFESWSTWNPGYVYIQDGETSRMKDIYITTTKGNFITIQKDSINDYIDNLKRIKDSTDAEFDEYKTKKENEFLNHQKTLLEVLKESKDYKSYDEVEVPEEWIKSYNSKEEAQVIAEKPPELSPAEKRKLEEKTIVSSLKFTNYRSDNKQFDWVKQEPRIKDLQDDKSQIVYGFGNDEDEKKLHFTALLLKVSISPDILVQNSGYYNDDFKLIRISESNKRYLKNNSNALYIDEFYRNTKSTTKVEMNNKLVNWNTARIVEEEIVKFKFLENFKNFNPEIVDLYKELKAYSNRYYEDVSSKYQNKFGVDVNMYKDLISYLNSANEMQLFIREHKDNADEIKNKSLELFEIDSIEQSIGLNLEIYDKLQVLVEFAEGIYPLLSQCECLVTENKVITNETEAEIHYYLEAKGKSGFKIPTIKLEVTEDKILEKVEEEVPA